VHLKFAAQVCLLKQKRDFVIIYHWFEQRDGSIVLVGHSVDHLDAPLVSGYIRGQVFASGYIITPKSSNRLVCKVVYMSHFDPRGIEIPEVIRNVFMNVILQQQPLNVLRIKNYFGIPKADTVDSDDEPLAKYTIDTNL